MKNNDKYRLDKFRNIKWHYDTKISTTLYFICLNHSISYHTRSVEQFKLLKDFLPS